MFDADENSIKIALIGTPLLKEERASWKIFGEYFHTYYYDKSIQDGYTLKIIREDIETSYKEKLSQIYEKLETLVEKKDIKKSQITGILNTTGGGEVGVTSASATAITADELIDLYHSLKEPYRKDAVWILNDSTVKAIRKLKDGNGQYLWQPGIKDGEENTILGRPYYTSAFVPSLAAGAKTVIFGNINYYWIGDREGITFKRLNELYAGNGQVGFLAYKRLDGKTVLPEAIKVLQMKSA